MVPTFGPEGRTLHPDHIAMHQFAAAAFEAAFDPDRYPQHRGSGLAPWAPLKLYSTTFPKSIRELIGPRFPGQPDEEIAVTLDVPPLLGLKRQAIKAHRAQQTPPFAHLTEARGREMPSRE